MADYETKMRAVKDELFSKIVRRGYPRDRHGHRPEHAILRGPPRRRRGAQRPELPIRRRQREKVQSEAFRSRGGDRRASPAPDASADTVVATLVNCTVGDVAAVTREVRRVLRPGGSISSSTTSPPRTDRRYARCRRCSIRLNRAAYEGCRLTRDPVEHILGAGFAEVEYERFVAGAAAASWLTAPSAEEALRSRRRETPPLDAIEPHFLLAPRRAVSPSRRADGRRLLLAEVASSRHRPPPRADRLFFESFESRLDVVSPFAASPAAPGAFRAVYRSNSSFSLPDGSRFGVRFPDSVRRFTTRPRSHTVRSSAQKAPWATGRA